MKGGHILEQKDIEEVLSMSNAYFTISRPVNDPFLGYLPGSSEREELKAELERQSNQIVKIPLIIGGQEIYTDKTIKVTMPHNHSHTLPSMLAGEKELKWQLTPL